MGMKIPKQDRETRQVEMVETYNLARSLSRVGGGWGERPRMKRALYHALAMTEVLTETELKGVREVMGLA